MFDGTLLIEAEMTDKCQLVHMKDGYIVAMIKWW